MVFKYSNNFLIILLIIIEGILCNPWCELSTVLSPNNITKDLTTYNNSNIITTRDENM